MKDNKQAAQSLYFIINPVSGKGKTVNRVVHRIEQYLIEKNINYHFNVTNEEGHAKALAAQVNNRTDISIVIVVGGDGTLHEVINGLYPSSIPIGYIPTGSGNDYAREMGIEKDPIRAIDKILKREIKKIDVARINQEYFINVTGIGLDGLVARLSNQSKLKLYLGKLIYVYGLIKGLFEFKAKEISIIIDGNLHQFKKVWLIAIANGRYYGGGMAICPKAKNNDGKLDICVVSNVSMLEILFIFPLVFFGKHIYHPNVQMFTGKQVMIHSVEELDVQSDGETFILRNLEGEIVEEKLYIV